MFWIKSVDLALVAHVWLYEGVTVGVGRGVLYEFKFSLALYELLRS